MSRPSSHRGNPPKASRAQSIVEFALTLPILLLLLFGIIEFGRIFQAWVTVQNAARAAIRYAVTGQYDKTDFPDSAFGSAFFAGNYPSQPASGGIPCQYHDVNNPGADAGPEALFR